MRPLVCLAEIAPELVLDLRPGRRNVDDDRIRSIGIEEPQRLTRHVVRLARAAIGTDRSVPVVPD